MPKLHEILAVEGDLEGTASKIIEEATVTFLKKPDHFLETVKRLEMFDEKRKPEEVTEHKPMVTTVAKKLGYVKKAISKHLNAFATKEASNQIASADLILSDGTMIANGVPACALLGLETKLKNLRSMYEAIPTLAPQFEWEHDGQRGAGVYKAKEEEVRFKTEKSVQHKVLYEATKEHPAQIKEWSVDVPIGKAVTDHWSGMLSPAEKSDIMSRLDDLIQSCKKARQRANNIEIEKLDIGDTLINYINEGTTPTKPINQTK